MYKNLFASIPKAFGTKAELAITRNDTLSKSLQIPVDNMMVRLSGLCPCAKILKFYLQEFLKID